MKKPQLENGFIRIATGDVNNDILCALISANLTSTEYQIVLYVMRKTWGWGKKSDWISYSQFMKITNKSRFSIWDGLKRLVRKNILVRQTKLGKKTLYQLNKNFNEWILVRKNILVRQTKLVRKTKHTSKVDLTQLVRQTKPTKDTNTKETIQKKPIAKAIKTYGNPDINKTIAYFKQTLKLPMLDGSQKQNRQYANLLIKKFGGLNGVKQLIEYTAEDNFWASRITSLSGLYYKGVQIISKKRGGQNDDKYRSIDATKFIQD